MTVYRKDLIPPDARNPESRLISEYTLAKFPTDRVILKQPLGGPVVGEDTYRSMERRLAASRPWRLEADAVAIRGDVLYLIEAKVNEYLYGLTKLPFYKLLVDDTPELAPYKGLEIRMRIVVPVTIEWLMTLAERTGIEVDVFKPDWIDAYLDYRASYWNASNRAARKARRDAVERLGL